MTLTLAQRVLRTAGLFQGLIALPTMLVFGEAVFEQLFWYYYSFRIYNFITSMFNSLMAAGILFIILIQHSSVASLSKSLTLCLEIAKSLLATLVWIWLMADSAFGPIPGYYVPPEGRPRGPRIVMSSISSVCLLFLFYPTLVFAYLEAKKGEALIEEEQVVGGAEGASDERTALLRD